MTGRDELDPARLSTMRSLLVEHARTDAAGSPARIRRRRLAGALAGFAAVAAVTATAVVIAVAGVPFAAAPPAASGTPTPTPTPTPTATATATASPSPTPTPDAPAPAPTDTAPPVPPSPVVYTCDTLVDPAVVEEWLAVGKTADELWPDQTELYGSFHQQFAEFGGLSCRWGRPQSDSVDIMSYAPLSPDQAVTMQTELSANGFTTEERPDGIVYIAPYRPGTFYLFTADAVFETNQVERFEELLPYRER
ncbi:hypothetical protein ACEXQB_004715 [Herbiconiux sp. P18]|uniref:hypothetical protein n=1 Tax=Herbiconiux liangxiaofengii TaxID=3342795 RepID=UPI0035BB3677